MNPANTRFGRRAFVSATSAIAVAATVALAAPANAATQYLRETASAVTVSEYMPWNAGDLAQMWFASRPGAKAELQSQNPIRGGLVQDFRLVVKGMGAGPFTVKVIYDKTLAATQVPAQAITGVRNGDLVPIRIGTEGSGCIRFYAVVSNSKGVWAVTSSGGRYVENYTATATTAGDDEITWTADASGSWLVQ